MLLRMPALLLACLAVQAQERSVGRGLNFYSHEKEAALGLKLAEDTRERTETLDSPKIQDYIARLGRQLAAQSPL